MISIDVVIPCYYASEIIQPCFEKLAIQTYKNFRVIMINDCSPFTDDEYKEIREQYKDRLNLEYYKTETNSGPGVVRQMGLDMTTADFIKFIDDDDELYDEYALENLVKTIKDIDFSNVIIVTSPSQHRWDDGRTEIIQSNFHHHASMFNVKILKKHNIHYEKELSYKEEDCAFGSLLCYYKAKYKYDEVRCQNITYIKKWSFNHKSLTASVSILDSFIALMTAKKYEISYAVNNFDGEIDDFNLIVPIIFLRILQYLKEENLTLTQKQCSLIEKDVLEYSQMLNMLHIDLKTVEIKEHIRKFFNNFFNGDTFYGTWNESDIRSFPLTYKRNLELLHTYVENQ